MICVNDGCDSHEIKVAETRAHETKNWIRDAESVSNVIVRGGQLRWVNLS